MEVTCRTIQGRLLLRPSADLNDVVMGVLGRAQKRHPVEICAVAFVSNHYHLLLWVADAKCLAGFMEYVNSNLAREVGRMTQWRDKIWSRRYQSIVVSHEEAAQVGRLRYLLAHGCASYCTSFQDLVVEVSGERLGRVRSAQSAGTS